MSDYKEQGTSLGGYEEHGPYHCEDCVHRLSLDESSPDSDKCLHPVIVIDPAPILASRRHGETRGQKWVQIDLERGCCKYVKQPAREKSDTDDNPIIRAAKKHS